MHTQSVADTKRFVYEPVRGAKRKVDNDRYSGLEGLNLVLILHVT